MTWCLVPVFLLLFGGKSCGQFRGPVSVEVCVVCLSQDALQRARIREGKRERERERCEKRYGCSLSRYPC